MLTYFNTVFYHSVLCKTCNEFLYEKPEKRYIHFVTYVVQYSCTTCNYTSPTLYREKESLLILIRFLECLKVVNNIESIYLFKFQFEVIIIYANNMCTIHTYTHH